MILCTIEREQQKILSFVITGHADSGPYGHDLVCSAVTAISFGTVNAIEEICKVSPEVETKKNGGYFKFKSPLALNDETTQKTQLLLEGMLVALKSIEQDYGQYIKIEERKGGVSNA